MHLYVYYEVPDNERPRVLDAIRSMQERLALEHGHRGQLLRRVDQEKQRGTWMEIYEHVDDTFEAHLKHAFDQSGVGVLLAGPRHLERFTDFD